MKAKTAMVLGLLGALAMASPSFGAGFAIIEQSVSGLGNAFAGGAASAEDATTIFFNPAGLTRLKGQQVVAGIHYISPRTEFKDEGSSVSPAFGGGALSGNDGGEGGEDAFVPNFYYSASLGDDWAIGLGINAPFGLSTEYDDGWKGRYHALRSDVMTVNINPSAAYKVNEHLSLGAGVSAQYVDAELSNAIDFGSIAFASSGGLLGAPQAADGKVVLEADDWSYGYNLGALYEFTENSRVGIAYRSRIEYTAEGKADFTMPAALAAASPTLAAVFADTDAKADITLPDSASVSLYHRFNPQWAVMADVTWTNWSTFKELRVEFDNPLKSDSVTDYSWEDSWRYSIGATYNPNEKLALRAGLAYDETPIPSAELRTPRVPGEDRLWTAVGLGYSFSDRANLDIGYAHLFVSDSKINRQAGIDPSGENFFAGTLVGEFENSVDIASVQFSYSF
jgi:long-chain fatty acid transport protein